MSEKKQKKKEPYSTKTSPSVKKEEVDLDIFDITVVKNKKLDPFLNVFQFEPDHIADNKLGNFFGIIEVTDHSEKSSYLPNLVAQVIKKEYYGKKNRDPEKSFEAALHRANLALADLTQHEIVQWMGNFKAVLGVIQNKNFFLTGVGGGRTLLIRDKKISDLSRKMDKDNGHPMKTFSDISSGTIEIGDKIIYASDSVFESFSWEDLKRHIKTFNSDELDNLLKSTIESEGENVGLIIINVKEKTAIEKASLKKKTQKNINYFGKTEEKEKKPKKKILSDQKEKKKLPKEKTAPVIEEEESIEKPEMIPLDQTPKTNMLPRKKEEGEKLFAAEKKQNTKTKEPSSQTGDEILSPFEKQPELYIKEDDADETKLPKKKKPSFSNRIRHFMKKKNPKKPMPLNRKMDKKNSKGNNPSEEKEPSRQKSEKDKKELSRFTNKFGKLIPEKETVKKGLLLAATKGKTLTAKTGSKMIQVGKNNYSKATTWGKAVLQRLPQKEDIDQKKIPVKNESAAEKIFPSLRIEPKQKDIPEEIPQTENLPEPNKKENIDTKFDTFWKKNSPSEVSAKTDKPIDWEKYTSKNKASSLGIKEKNYFLKKLTPTFKKIRQNKYFDTVVIFALIVVLVLLGFFLIKKITTNPEKTSPGTETSTSQQPHSQPEPNLSISSKKEDQSPTSIVANLQTDALHFASDSENLFVQDENNQFSKINLTDGSITKMESEIDISETLDLVFMADLNLIFFVKKDTIPSFSTVTEKFFENNISLPNDLDLIDSGTYLTFLYLFNRTDTQIYRYPRAEGGFGSQVEWLSAESNLNPTEVTGMAVDENIRISDQNSSIKKYFRGKLEEEKQFEDPTIVIDKIHTNEELNHYLLLDKEAAKIYQIGKESNEIEQEYFNEEFRNALDLIALNNQVYILLANKIIKINS